jgi:hypothetical protein
VKRLSNSVHHTGNRGKLLGYHPHGGQIVGVRSYPTLNRHPGSRYLSFRSKFGRSVVLADHGAPGSLEDDTVANLAEENN